jgi:hypothetical protein
MRLSPGKYPAMLESIGITSSFSAVSVFAQLPWNERGCSPSWVGALLFHIFTELVCQPFTYLSPLTRELWREGLASFISESPVFNLSFTM